MNIGIYFDYGQFIFIMDKFSSQLATYVSSKSQQSCLFNLNVLHIITRSILLIWTLHSHTHLSLSPAQKESLSLKRVAERKTS